MRQYHDLVASVLENGTHKPNRTGVDTVSDFSHHYEVDLREGFPLLTTKRMDGYRWNSLIHELLWYLSGEEHVRNLREETAIWDAWADDDGRLDTAYGRFWRRFPVPEGSGRLSGESWPEETDRWVRTEEAPDGSKRRVFDQIAYVLDTLQEAPNSRRMVVSAWHPANAADSTLPPCHYTFVFNVQGGRLNTHLTQRSGDIALGVPFNLAAYSILTHAVANQTDLTVGSFGHTIVDAHIYCGEGKRAAWYAENLPQLRERVAAVDDRAEYASVRRWLEDTAPPEPNEPGYDHIPGLLTQLSREPRSRPRISVAQKPLDALEFADVELQEYDPAPGIDFAVAE
ncbi:MAG: thymidylate synthase [Natronomonas sp.]